MTVVTMTAIHIPVMVREVIDALGVRPGGRYVDCTVGEGGHAEAILEAASPRGQLLGIDLDPAALAVAEERLHPYGDSVTLVEGNYEEIGDICRSRGFGPIDGVLLDLGISSFQLEHGRRGFSFSHEGPLDMRFSPTEELTAADVVNGYREEELADVLWRFGEERRSRRIARCIMEQRPILTTTQLAGVVEQAVGKRGQSVTHPATRTFLALRIAVNQELAHLAAALQKAHGLLDNSGARLVVLAYHSLEDRIVKEFFRREARDCICPPETPACICDHRATIRLLTPRPQRPSDLEVLINPRSRSARLRAAERL
ncbi:MAG: 16S rRNA (cytosine(1402)-N(4))-methyltransferase RsmH [Dehalococcoidia bacterium]|jgi:16S rRNA (cytosine1402-N4)-methyltransferase